MSKVELLSLIEESRKKLHDFVSGKNLTDTEVVKMSQQLDRLLNLYHRWEVAA